MRVIWMWMTRSMSWAAKQTTMTIRWITKNLFQIARFIFAIVILVIVTTTFLDIGSTLLTKEIKSIVVTPVSKTEIETVLPVATNACAKCCPDKSKEQIIKKKSETGTATQQVFVYALQLVAWLGLIGISLWAVVALTRDE